MAFPVLPLEDELFNDPSSYFEDAFSVDDNDNPFSQSPPSSLFFHRRHQRHRSSSPPTAISPTLSPAGPRTDRPLSPPASNLPTPPPAPTPPLQHFLSSRRHSHSRSSSTNPFSNLNHSQVSRESPRASSHIPPAPPLPRDATQLRFSPMVPPAPPLPSTGIPPAPPLPCESSRSSLFSFSRGGRGGRGSTEVTALQQQHWECPCCTLHNPLDANQCQVCMNDRPTPHSGRRSKASPSLRHQPQHHFREEPPASRETFFDWADTIGEPPPPRQRGTTPPSVMPAPEEPAPRNRDQLAELFNELQIRRTSMYPDEASPPLPTPAPKAESPLMRLLEGAVSARVRRRLLADGANEHSLQFLREEDLLRHGVPCLEARRVVALIQSHFEPASQSPLPLDLECKVCMERRIATTLIPCSHAILCTQCAHQVVSSAPKKCPLCRADIDRWMSIYFG